MNGRFGSLRAGWLSCRGIVLAAIAVGMAGGCRRSDVGEASAGGGPHQPTVAHQGSSDPYTEARQRMVSRDIAGRDVTSKPVLEAMRTVQRHLFVPEDQRADAYDDRPLPIGFDQTISQPYIVAKMTELARVNKSSKVLEIGTGSGYQAAVLAEVAGEVYTIEIVKELAEQADATLKQLGYTNVFVRHGDGFRGWPEHAPFDAVVVTAAPPRVPEPLKQQLAVGGTLVIPVGQALQQLKVLTRSAAGFDEKSVFPVRFVPMTGEAQRP